MESYENLVEEAYEQIKQVSKSTSRFEIPKLDIQNIGNRTVFGNFMQVVSYLRRTPENVCKFLTKELASQGKFENDRLIFNRKIFSSQIKEKLELYVKRYVLCKECGKPDTELIKEDDFLFIHCLACGAKHSLGR